jgi:hypothetical protein
VTVKTSESIKEIAGALAKAQAEMGRVVKDKTAKVQMKTGGSYSFDYADLASVLDAVKPALAKHGIAVVQTAALEGDKVAVETRLIHASGEWLESTLAVKPEDVAPQKIGSAITYARRYALSCMVGVASEEDDDGNAAQGNHATTQARARPAPPAANGSAHATTKAPASPEARKSDLKARMLKAGVPGAKIAEQLGEWLGRPVDGATVISVDDWMKADAGIEQSKAAGAVLAHAAASAAMGN